MVVSTVTARVKALALRGVVTVLTTVCVALAVVAGARADTVTASCAAGDNTQTTYCPAVVSGTDDEPAVMAGFAAGGIVAFGVGAVVGVVFLYRRIVGGGVR